MKTYEKEKSAKYLQKEIFDESFDETFDKDDFERTRLAFKTRSKTKGIFQRMNTLRAEDKPLKKDERDISQALVKDARISMRFWEEGWYFLNILDTTWREFTHSSNDVFPVRMKPGKYHTHPGYIVREVANYGIALCPCSSKCYSKSRYIKKGEKLLMTQYEMDRDSYIVETVTCILPRNDGLFDQLPKFAGIYPPEKLSK